MRAAAPSPSRTKRWRFAWGSMLSPLYSGLLLIPCTSMPSALRRPFRLLRIVEGDGVGDGLGGQRLAAHLQRRALHGLVDVEAGDRHRTVGELRIARSGDDADLFTIGENLVAEIGGTIRLDQQTKDLEAFLALEACMFL